MAESKGKSYRVTAPLVVAHRGDGHGDVYVYQGGLLPDDVDADQVKQLLDGELVEEAK